MPPSQISFKIHNEDISLISTGAEVTASEESKGSAGSGRTSVILATLAFYQLLGTGVLAALVAIRQPDKTIGFSCALAAAVNAVALGHYMAIWRVRSQAVRAKEKVAGGDQDVEVLRHSDWAITLPLMTLDLYMLAEQATGGAEAPISKYTAALLMTVMVLLGATYHFVKVHFLGSTLNVLSFLGACVVFTVVVWGILDPLVSDVCPPGVNATDVATGTCPISDENKKTDEAAVFFLTLVWIGYPVVSILSRIFQSCVSPDGKSFDARISFAKDFFYAVLDVTSKGGLALYAVFRSTWL